MENKNRKIWEHGLKRKFEKRKEKKRKEKKRKGKERKGKGRRINYLTELIIYAFVTIWPRICSVLEEERGDIFDEVRACKIERDSRFGNEYRWFVKYA